jgi:hypothetical protein
MKKKLWNVCANRDMNNAIMGEIAADDLPRLNREAKETLGKAYYKLLDVALTKAHEEAIAEHEEGHSAYHKMHQSSKRYWKIAKDYCINTTLIGGSYSGFPFILNDMPKERCISEELLKHTLEQLKKMDSK